MFFRTVPVFDVSQPVPLTPPARPIEGDSHAYLIAPLEEHARQLCYGVHVYKLPEHGAGGRVGPGVLRDSLRYYGAQRMASAPGLPEIRRHVRRSAAPVTSSGGEFRVRPS